jgi:sulfite exporter TauE/SafE
MILLLAISLGFLGSFHCIGMCGPIALSIPVKSNSKMDALLGGLVYNSGRIFTYSIMGLLFGLIGSGFAMAGLQNTVSIVLGSAILVLVFIPRFSFLNVRSGLIGRLLEKLKTNMRKLFGTYSQSSLFLIGLLNGLLPCGLVYLAIAGSVATGDVWEGSLFMAGFGLGTLPAMLGVSLVRHLITMEWRQRIRRSVPVFAGLMAVMLILRGMSLGIPYISPSMGSGKGEATYNCCHK